MLELDLAVTLALVLSVASTVLCVGYGLTHWNADDDADENPPSVVPSSAKPDRAGREPDAP